MIVSQRKRSALESRDFEDRWRPLHRLGAEHQNIAIRERTCANQHEVWRELGNCRLPIVPGWCRGGLRQGTGDSLSRRQDSKEFEARPHMRTGWTCVMAKGGVGEKRAGPLAGASEDSRLALVASIGRAVVARIKASERGSRGDRESFNSIPPFKRGDCLREAYYRSALRPSRIDLRRRATAGI
jgi:hypothetical protein